MRSGDYVADDFRVNCITENYITLYSSERVPTATLYEVMEKRGYLAVSSPIVEGGYCLITFRRKS